MFEIKPSSHFTEVHFRDDSGTIVGRISEKGALLNAKFHHGERIDIKLKPRGQQMFTMTIEVPAYPNGEPRMDIWEVLYAPLKDLPPGHVQTTYVLDVSLMQA